MKEIQTPRSGEIYMGSDKGLYQIVCTAIDASSMQKLIIFQELQGGFNTYALADERFNSSTTQKNGVKAPMFKKVFVNQDGSIEENIEEDAVKSESFSHSYTGINSDKIAAADSNISQADKSQGYFKSTFGAVSIKKAESGEEGSNEDNPDNSGKYEFSDKTGRKLVLGRTDHNDLSDKDASDTFNDNKDKSGVQGSKTEDSFYKIKEFDELEDDKAVDKKDDKEEYSMELMIKFFDAKTDIERKQLLQNNKLKITQNDLNVIYEAFEIPPFDGGKIFQIECLISYLDTRMKFEGS